MKRLSLAIVAVLALASCNQQPVSNNKIQYLPFQETEKSGWGLIGTDGHVLAGDDYKQMTTLVIHDRFFAKNKQGKWELYGVDTHAKQIGTDEYTQAGAFIADVAPVVEEGKSIEFIDVNGKVAFTLDRVNGKEVSTCTNFSDGVAVFRAGKYCGAINTKGEVIVDPRYIEILPASEGKMLALDKKFEDNLKEGDIDNIKYTVIGTDGKELGMLSTRRFKIASRAFVNGALVVTDESGNGTVRTGLIDEKGDWIVKPSDGIKSIKSINNRTFIYSDGDAWGVMDFEGKDVIKPRYASLIYANETGLLFAKPDKEKANYQLMDMQENKVGRDEYSNVLPFIEGNAIVQESANNWILINDKGEDQRLKQDIYSISASSFGDEILVSEHVDYESIIGALKLTKDGFLDMTLNMDAEHIANAVWSIEVAGELGGTAMNANPQHFVNVSTINGHFIASGIQISLSSTFDEPMATKAPAFKNITPNQIGLEIPAVGMLRGKSGIMARDIINRVQAFGQTVKSNNNAAIVSVGEKAYFVANSGKGVYVVYGYLDVNQIDIEPYKNIVDTEAAPLKRYEVKDIFDITPGMYDVYEIGGAFDSEEYEAMLQEFVDNTEKITQALKSAAINPEDLNRVAQLVKEAQAIGEKLDNVKDELSESQLRRFLDAYKSLRDASEK